jgi:hypothetical protein
LARVGVLLTDPGEEALHPGLVLQALQAVELAGKAAVVEEDVDLAVACGAEVGGRAVLALLLAGDEVMDGEATHLPFEQLAAHARENNCDLAGVPQAYHAPGL